MFDWSVSEYGAIGVEPSFDLIKLEFIMMALKWLMDAAYENAFVCMANATALSAAD